MKRLLPAFLALFLALCALTPAVPARAQDSPPDFNIMPVLPLALISWNIESSQSSAEEIARQMGLFDGVEVWLLQGVKKDDVALLEAGAEAGEDANFESVLSDTGGDNRLLILYDADRLSMGDGQTKIEVQVGSVAHPVPLLLVALADLAIGSAIGVLDMRLDASDTVEHLSQAIWLQSFAAPMGDTPLIAAGDMEFEAAASDFAFGMLTVGGVWQHVAPINNTPSRLDGKTVDHVFALGVAQNWPVEVRAVEREGDSGSPPNSSHRPVLARVGYNARDVFVPCAVDAKNCSPAHAAPATSATITGKVKVSNANLRSGPGKNYAVVGHKLKGDPITISGVSPDGAWYALDPSGWIAAAQVRTDSSVSALRIVLPAGATTSTATPSLATLSVERSLPQYDLICSLGAGAAASEEAKLNTLVTAFGIQPDEVEAAAAALDEIITLIAQHAANSDVVHDEAWRTRWAADWTLIHNVSTGGMRTAAYNCVTYQATRNAFDFYICMMEFAKVGETGNAALPE